MRSPQRPRAEPVLSRGPVLRYRPAMSNVEALIEESIEVNAEPGTVWALVTDLPRMAKWSPQVAKTVVRGGPVGLGTTAININRRGPLVWPTRSKVVRFDKDREFRSEEHTSELQSLMRISYAVFCLKKKKIKEIEQKNRH